MPTPPTTNIIILLLSWNDSWCWESKWWLHKKHCRRFFVSCVFLALRWRAHIIKQKKCVCSRASPS
jgi:hypothetical protein